MKPRIMLVEDEQKTAKFLAAALEAADIAVDHYADGPGAINGYRKGSYRLIVLDFKLPGMCGDEVLQAIRAVDSQVPVMIFTNYHDQALEKRLAPYRVDRYLDKGCGADLWETAAIIGQRVIGEQEEGSSWTK